MESHKIEDTKRDQGTKHLTNLFLKQSHAAECMVELRANYIRDLHINFHVECNIY